MRAIAVFLLIAFGFSWACAYWLYRLGGLAEAGQAGGLILLVYMFGPGLGAVAAALLFDRGRILEALGFRKLKIGRVAVWLVYGWFVAAALCALSVIIILVLTGQPPADAAGRIMAQVEAAGQDLPMTADQLLLLTLTVSLPVGVLVNTILITFNEELGWRGWLQPRLAGLGFWPAALVSGVIWGVWHAPIIWMGWNYPGMGVQGVGLMIAWCVLLTPYLALARERGGGVWAAGAFHGSLNGVTGVTLLYLPDPAWPTNGLLGLYGFALLAAGWAAIFAYRWMRPLKTAPGA